MGMVVPTHRERLCQALGTVVTPRWHSCAKGVARARYQRPSLPSYIGGFSSTIIAIGRTHFIKGQQVPSCAYFPEDQVHIQEGCLKTMKQPCTISMISVYKRPISFSFSFIHRFYRLRYHGFIFEPLRIAGIVRMNTFIIGVHKQRAGNDMIRSRTITAENYIFNTCQTG